MHGRYLRNAGFLCPLLRSSRHCPRAGPAVLIMVAGFLMNAASTYFWGKSVQEEVCPEKGLSRGRSVQGEEYPGESLSIGRSVQRNVCPGGGTSRGVLSKGRSVRGRNIQEEVYPGGGLSKGSLSKRKPSRLWGCCSYILSPTLVLANQTMQPMRACSLS